MESASAATSTCSTPRRPTRSPGGPDRGEPSGDGQRHRRGVLPRVQRRRATDRGDKRHGGGAQARRAQGDRRERYKFGPDDDIDEMTGEDVVCYLAAKARDDDLERAGTRILNDFRKTARVVRASCRPTQAAATPTTSRQQVRLQAQVHFIPTRTFDTRTRTAGTSAPPAPDGPRRR